MLSKIYIISLGGSIIVPNEIDFEFLKNFKKLILAEIKKNKKFIIVAGGGKMARRYIEAAGKVSKITNEDKDWLGIHGTRLNAHLLRTIFKDYAQPHINHDPRQKENFKKPLLFAAGWKPGCSTDYDAVLLARKYGINTIVNLSNVEKIYDKDPAKFKDARPLDTISWTDLKKMVGDKWVPGANAPFDPIASQVASARRMKVVFMDGHNLKNFKAFLNDKKFVGTVIA